MGCSLEDLERKDMENRCRHYKPGSYWCGMNMERLRPCCVEYMGCEKKPTGKCDGHTRLKLGFLFGLIKIVRAFFPKKLCIKDRTLVAKDLENRLQKLLERRLTEVR